MQVSFRSLPHYTALMLLLRVSTSVLPGDYVTFMKEILRFSMPNTEVRKKGFPHLLQVKAQNDSFYENDRTPPIQHWG